MPELRMRRNEYDKGGEYRIVSTLVFCMCEVPCVCSWFKVDDPGAVSGHKGSSTSARRDEKSSAGALKQPEKA